MPAKDKIDFKRIKFIDPVSLLEISSSESDSVELSSSPNGEDDKCLSNISIEESLSMASSDGFSEFQIPDSFEFTEIKEEMLYPGSSVSLLSTLSILMTWFTDYPSLSKQAFSQLLYLLHKFILPPSNNLPSSYTKAYSLVKHHLIEPQEFHVCINDCVVFRKEYKDLTCCPICGSNRYEDDSQQPLKRFKYLLLLPRIQHMFATPNVSELLQSHSIHRTQTKVVCDIHDSDAWKQWYAKNGCFAGNARGICFALCTDGVNPFSHVKCQYSMWPIMLNVLNFPLDIRAKTKSLLLVGIIPGRKEPKNLDPYLNILIDDINDISGHTLLDSLKDEPFFLKG